jgi:hypothetical protein
VDRLPTTHTFVAVYAWPHNLDNLIAAHAAAQCLGLRRFLRLYLVCGHPIEWQLMFMSMWMRTIGASRLS